MHSNALTNIEKAQEHQKKHYAAKHNTNTKLKVGDNVLVKDMKNEGKVVTWTSCFLGGGGGI